MTLGPPTEIQRPSTWRKYRSGMCEGCFAGCCTLPVEVSFEDLVRLELASIDESPKKAAQRLTKEKIVRYYRGGSGVYTLEQRPNDDCIFLDDKRLCKVYDKRPDVCRKFPTIGPRPGYCPAKGKA